MAEIRKVVPSEMEAQAQVIHNLAENEWSEAVSNVDAYKKELDGMWDGLANDSFNERWNNDYPKYKALQAIMSDYAKAVQEAAKQYQSYEEQIKAIVEN